MPRSSLGTADACLELLRRLMNGESLTVSEAERVCGGHKQPAVRNHLKQLAETIPGVRTTGGRPERWYYDRQNQEGVRVPVGSLWVLAAARALLPGLGESTLGDVLDELTVELARHVPDGHRASDDLSRKFYSNQRTLDLRSLDVVAQAIFECFEIAADYQHFGGAVDSVVLRPLTLVRFADRLYCYAQVVDSSIEAHLSTKRMYNVEGIGRARKTGQRFAYPAGDAYRPDDIFHHSFAGFVPYGEDQVPEQVTLEFTPRWDTYLRSHPIHRSQSEVVLADDRWCRVHLKVFILHDLVRFIRGLGNECRVVGPDHLREWVLSGEGSNWQRP
jgi:predicted DNA-binding transcriptional regulator YafY